MYATGDGDLDALPWGLLQLVAVLDRAGSVTRAAHTLRTSQPALSRRMRSAERVTGAPLFRRSSTGISATALGATVVARAARLGAGLVRCAAPLLPAPATLTVASYVVALGEVIDWMGERWPGTRWDVADQPLGQVGPLLERGAVDLYLGVHTTHHAAFAAPVRRRLAVCDPLWLAMSRRHPLAQRSELSLGDLAGEEWLTSPDPAVERLFVTSCRRLGFEPRIRYRTERTRTIRDLVADGRAITMCVPVARADETVVVRPVPGLPSLDVVVAWHPERVADDVAEDIVGLLRGWYLWRAQRVGPYWRWLDAHPEAVFPIRPAAQEPGALSTGADWDDLQALYETLRAGSAASAAHRLGCSEHTVRRRVHRVERQVGVALLGSHGGRPTPTRAGFAMLGHLYLADLLARGVTGSDDG